MNALKTAISLAPRKKGNSMTTLAAIGEVTPIIYKLAKRAVEADHNHFYGLLSTVDYGRIQTSRFPAFSYKDEVWLIEKVNDDTMHFWLQGFEPESKLWDGTSNLPDGGTKSLDCLFRASLFHDCGYAKVEDISKATGIPEKDLLAFFDDCFKILAEGYGASKKVTNPVYQALRLGGSLYHKIMKLFAVVLILLTLQGCYSVKTQLLDPPPEVQFTGPFFKKDIQNDNQGQNHQGASEAPAAAAQGQSPQG